MPTELPILYTAGATPFIAIGQELQNDFRFVFINSAAGNTVRDLGGQVALMEDAFDMTALAEAQTAALWLQYKITQETSCRRICKRSTRFCGHKLYCQFDFSFCG